MIERKKMWVDPPSGWQYGFPKIYEPAKDGSLKEFLVREGYPADMLAATTLVRLIDMDEGG